jgi:hypothetical protein
MSENQPTGILDNIAIATPCSASWDGMKGDDRVRDCSQCRLSVYNLSAMSKHEAETLIRERAGNVCVRLYRRFDGTVITDDCPLALRKLRDSLNYAAGILATLLSFFLGFAPVRAQTAHHTMGKVVAHPHAPQEPVVIDSSSNTSGPTIPSSQNSNPPIHKTPPKAAVRNYSWPKHTDRTRNNR